MRVLATDIDRLMLPNTLTLRANDLLLLHNGTRCMVQQVAAGFSNAVSLDVPVTLAGTYAANAAGASALGDFGDGGAGAYLMGNLNDSRPQFQLIGVGADRALFSYDLLRLGPDDAPMPVADSVVALRALYGVDTNGDGRQDVWVDPIDGTDFGADMLLDGSAASNARLQQIVSLRVGLVLRTSLLEREARPLDTVTLFGDLPAAQQQSLEIAGDDQRYHYRTVESTVPLRNAMP